MDSQHPHQHDKSEQNQAATPPSTEADKPTSGQEQAKPADHRAEIAAMSDEELAILWQRAEQATLYLEALQRAKADYDNYQKRVEKERDSTYKYAIQNLVRELLRVADIFAFAAQSAAAQQKDKEYQNFYDGMCLVQEELHKIFRQFGVQTIEAKNRKFDVRYHEAIRQIETADHPEMTVVEELEKGYMLHDRLLRASKVVVSRKPQPKPEAENKTQPEAENKTQREA